MKVINFFGAPGVGKSTMAMFLTSLFKQSQVDAEVSLEFVKEYIHAGNENLLAYQNYIFAQQERQLRILLDSKEAEFAVTDAPLLHSVFYAPEKYPVYFKDLVFEIFHSYENINFLINRKHPYSFNGRIHSEEKSDLIAKKLPAFLMNHNIPYIEIDSDEDVKEKIFKYLMENHRDLEYQKNKKIRT
jgi:adenylate kinase family enzyme